MDTVDSTVDRVIVALDMSSVVAANDILRQLSKASIGPRRIKVGSIAAHRGLSAIHDLGWESKLVFWDHKYHDIPATVGNYVSSIICHGIGMISLHCEGGEQMLKAASVAAGKNGGSSSRLVGITVLSSDGGDAPAVAREVIERAKMSADCGLGHVTVPPSALGLVREYIPDTLKIIVPGIRPAWYRDSDNSLRKQDHKEPLTPSRAIELGADYIVIGRPICSPPEGISPLEAWSMIIQELKEYSTSKEKQEGCR